MSPASAGAILDAGRTYLAEGGAVMIPLALSAAALWWAVGLRAVLLRRGTRAEPAAALAAARGRAGGRPRGLVDAAAQAVAAAAATARPGGRRGRLDEALAPLAARLDAGAVVARTIVAVAPLLGLLGTVSGMIEMFDSLGEGTFAAQEGGIAQGIAEALFTTQLGLAIAIPGYFATRLLDRRAGRLRAELERLKDLACLEAA